MGRLTPDGEEVLLNKRFTAGKEVRVKLELVRSKSADRSTFEAWLRTLAGGAMTEQDSVARVLISGDAWLVRNLAEASGLSELLVRVFGPEDGGAILGLAAHQFTTGHALYRAESWLTQREFPPAWSGPLVSETSVHGFIARIGADVARRESFLEQWVARHKDKAALVYDTTSVSTHSPSLDLAEWGYNRDDESLPQVNFSLAATPDGMPLFYRVIPGSIPDVRTLSVTLRIAREYGLQKLGLSLDRGFYSAANLREILGLECSLVLGVPWSVSQAQALFKRHRTRLESPRHAFLYRGNPLRHIAQDWLQDEKTMTAHLYFDPARHADAALRLEKQVFGLVEKAAGLKFADLGEAKAWIRENAGYRASCLRVVAKDGAPPTVEPKPNRMVASSARAGYTLVLTCGRDPDQETAEAVLRDYRARDLAEKLFDAFKTEHSQYRLRSASDVSVQGRFFLGFATLALRAELDKRMRSASLQKTMTDANVLDEMSKIKTLISRKGTRILLELSKKQRSLLAHLGIPELT